MIPWRCARCRRLYWRAKSCAPCQEELAENLRATMLAKIGSKRLALMRWPGDEA